MNRKIYPVHQSILQTYCQRIEHIRSEKRDVTKTEALSLQHHCFTSGCFAWLLSKNFSAARAYQIPMLIVIWTIFADYSLRFVKTIAKLNFLKYRVLEPRTAQNSRPRRAEAKGQGQHGRGQGQGLHKPVLEAKDVLEDFITGRVVVKKENQQ